MANASELGTRVVEGVSSVIKDDNQPINSHGGLQSSKSSSSERYKLESMIQWARNLKHGDGKLLGAVGSSA